MNKYSYEYENEITKLADKVELLESKLEQAEKERRELKSKASNLIFLHSCEEEGLSSGQPTKEDWRIAIDELAELLTTE